MQTVNRNCYNIMEAYRRSEKVKLDLGVDVVKRHQIQNFESILDFETHN